MAAINPDSIALHSAQSKYYKYREPYLPALFDNLSSKLQLDRESRLLDLCCGNGELAAGFADRVDKIYAVDGSAEMLSFAPRHSRIMYSRCDINSEIFKTPELVDHFLIGRAIHWISAESLGNLVEHNLKSDGKIVICSTQWSTHDAWYEAYASLIGEYRNYENYRKHDFRGTGTLSEIGFKAVDRISLTTNFSFDLRYLIGHTLSSTYGDRLDKLSANIDRFESNIFKELSPHLREGKLNGELTSWAIIYKQQ